MCFYDGDPDWYASVIEDETRSAESPVKCDECRRLIPPGAMVRHIFMQEREVCRHDPESDDYDPDESGEPDCHDGCEHDFGETFDYDRCETCDQLIESIHQHELAEGCGEHESRPSLTELYDAMDRDRGPGYLATAERIYPGITSRLPKNFLSFRDEDEE